MSGKLELVWDERGPRGGAIPLFDARKGSTVITATPKGVKRIRCKEERYLVQYYPMSHEMLKAVGDAAAIANEEGIYFSILLTDSWHRKIGFAAFKE